MTDMNMMFYLRERDMGDSYIEMFKPWQVMIKIK